MENQLITVEELMRRKDDFFLVDVRSPVEYKRACIPGAFNVPLFNEEERAKVGITYKEKGLLEAKLIGIEIVSPKLYSMVQRVMENSRDRPVVFYCWRGGLRSKIMVKLFGFLGLEALQLQGGYKAHRRFIYHQLCQYEVKSQFVVLNGLTGTGKTEILTKLSYRWPVIDLENLARHRGSVFGNLGLKEPRSQKDFEALLWQRLEQHKGEPFIIAEGEGRRIGPLFLPSFMVQGIENGIHILLQASLETRTKRILKEYTRLNPEVIIREAQAPIEFLERNLGKEKVQYLLERLQKGDFYEVVKNLCRDHYDQKYGESKVGNNVFHLIVDTEDIQQAVQIIEDFLKNVIHVKPPVEA